MCANPVPEPRSKPIRTVLRWQVIATAALAAAAGLLGGAHGAFSALLGGTVSVLGGLASARVLANVASARARSRSRSSVDLLIGALQAEIVKIALIALLLWLVFVIYKDVNALSFIGTFAVTTVIFSLAIAVRDN